MDQRTLNLEHVVRRDRAVAAAALAALVVLAWVWLLRMDHAMAMPGMAMPAGRAFSPATSCFSSSCGPS